MSETTTRNPNQSDVRLTRKGKAAIAGAAVIGIVAGGAVAKAGADQANEWFDKREQHNAMVTNLQKPDALKSYLAGTAFKGANRNKVVHIKATDFMAPDSLSRELTKDNDSQAKLTRQILPQADGQGDPGVQPGEEFVLERALLSEDAIAEYQVVPEEQ